MARKTNKTVAVDSVRHKDTRKNIPTEELRSFVAADEAAPQTLLYPRDPSLDPQLVWKGKDEQDRQDLAVPAVPIYIQEKIHPQALIEDVRAEGKKDHPESQFKLFADFNGLDDDFQKKVDFYQHEQHWANRMILGDSLLVMTSLAEKEGLKGKVQMIYVDPPYGIKFGSNWQVSTRKRDVKDGKVEDATRQPEQIRAFRDTWKLGIHSYLSYLRDRFAVARELLTETGSIFVQIGGENVHLVRCVLEEVFGAENFVAQVTFAKTTGSTREYLPGSCDFLLFYAKDRGHLKFRQPYANKSVQTEVGGPYNMIELPDGSRRRMTAEERANPAALIPSSARVFRIDNLQSQSIGREKGPGASSWFAVEHAGQQWYPTERSRWKTNDQGMTALQLARRLEATAGGLYYVRFIDDFPAAPVADNWTDTVVAGFASDKKYVVETSTKVVERCLIMTTDPGDLVLDPTCVRRGTLVLTPLYPPASGGRAGRSLASGAGCPPACGASTGSPPAEGRAAPPSPLAGRAGVGFVPVESLRPGDWVYAHDGQPHRVLRTLRRSYCGPMTGLRHADSPHTLWLTGDHLVLSERYVKHLSPRGQWSHVPRAHFGRARQLRREPSPPEALLWQRLRHMQLGVKFRRQHPIGPYIADFYSRQAALVVEVDGGTHYATPEAVAYDQERDRYMTGLGLRVLRCSAQEVSAALDSVAETVADAAREAVLSDDPAKQWRRADRLQVGDVVFCGVDRVAQSITAIEREETSEEVYDLEVDGAHSFLTAVCAVHNCGSGTTAYVAEQWGRRWITIDTSRVALALARTRLMAAKYPYYLLADSPDGVRRALECGGLPPLSGGTPAADSTAPPQSGSKLPHSKFEGDIKKGFVYKRVPHVTLKSIANNPDIKEGMTRAEIDAAIARRADTELLYDQPYEDGKRVRVTGPFTVESLSPHRVLAPDEERPASEMAAQQESTGGQFELMIIDNLRKAGVQNTRKNERLIFDRLDPYAGEWLHAAGEFTDKDGAVRRVAVSIGPEHGTVGADVVKEAAKEALRGLPFDLLVVCGFAFDAHASETAKEFSPADAPPKKGIVAEGSKQFGKLPVLLARINPDLAMGNELLKKTGAANLFMVFGEPDVKIDRTGGGKIVVEIKGVDVYDPTTGQIRSGSTDDIACWFIDTSYNQESFFVRHAYFTGAEEPYDKLKRALRAEIDEAAWSALYATTSRPFDPPATGKIAIKVINHYGDEVLKVYEIAR